MDKWEIFEQSRTRLHQVARRIVGSTDDADDIVQETSLRWMRAEAASVRAPEGWLVTVATRLALDHARRTARQQQIHHAAVVAERDLSSDPGVADAAEPTEEKALEAFFLLRSRLAPAERLAFLLREVFGCDYAEVARALRKSEAACRQIVHRARARVRQPARRIAMCRDEEPELAARFITALGAGDREVALAALTDRGDNRVATETCRARPLAVQADRPLHSAA